eukprot:GILK01008419.1.p1 GENE.GILK01008419.1~~GILK01008419.1.p1  ORF type:complete len:650 (-),score=76.95 GILK01008419.1:122-2020(-)
MAASRQGADDYTCSAEEILEVLTDQDATSELLKFIVNDEQLLLVTALCDANTKFEVEVAHALISIFQRVDGDPLRLLKSAIQRELGAIDSAIEVFRSNALSTKLVTAFSKLHGRTYLYDVLGPLILEISEQQIALEADPSRIDSRSDLTSNVNRVIFYCERVIKAIESSVETCPLQLRRLCAYIYSAVYKRFPSYEHRVIGSFIILRFFNAAVVSPEQFGILKDPPTACVRRSLIIISKILQSISNGVEFGNKEPYMSVFNDFVSQNMDRMKTFFTQLSNTDDLDESRIDRSSSAHRTYLQDMETLRKYIRENNLKIANSLKKVAAPGQADNPRMSAVLGPAPSDSFNRSASDSNIACRGHNSIRTRGISLYERYYDQIAQRALHELVQQAEETEGWIHVRDKQHVSIFKKKSAESSIHYMRGSGRCNFPPREVVSACFDATVRKDWDPLLISCTSVEQILNHSIVYMQFRSPLERIVQNRDFVCLRTLHEHVPGRPDVVAITSKSIKREDVPKQKHFVRGHIETAGFLIKRIPDDPSACDVTYVVNIDPKGMVPSFIANIVGTKQPLCIDSIRSFLTKVHKVVDVTPSQRVTRSSVFLSSLPLPVPRPPTTHEPRGSAARGSRRRSLSSQI